MSPGLPRCVTFHRCGDGLPGQAISRLSACPTLRWELSSTPFDVVNALYGEFFERGVRHFFPSLNIEALGRSISSPPGFTFCPRPDGRLEVQWGGLAYAVHHDGRSLSAE